LPSTLPFVPTYDPSSFVYVFMIPTQTFLLEQNEYLKS